MPDTSPPVLIIGAGPVGLALGVELARRQVRCRLIDKKTGPSAHSKALAIFPRTLEVFEAMGVTGSVLEQGQHLYGGYIYQHERPVLELSFDTLPSPYAFVISLPQSQTERILLERLQALGGQVEWETELLGLEAGSGVISARMRRANGQAETAQFTWAAGCDGAHSTVRHQLGFEFQGKPYEQGFILADAAVRSQLRTDRLHLFFGSNGLLGYFPFRGGRGRIIMDDTLPPEPGAKGQAEPSLDAIRPLVAARCPFPLELTDAHWTSRFHVSHRMVKRFRKGNVFLAGDAAHIHSPAGGQGMNTGIQDAFNLGWKLAAVIKGQLHPDLLDTYASERMPVARDVLNLTDRITRLALLRGPWVDRARELLVPLVGVLPVRQSAALRLSELEVNYRRRFGVNPITRPKVDAGDRAPDAELFVPAGGQARRLFELLRRDEYTLLGFSGSDVQAARGLWTGLLEALQPYRELVAPAFVSRSTSPGGPDPGAGETLLDRTGLAHQTYGITNPTAVLVRPDLYVAYRCSLDAPAGLRSCLDRLRHGK
jgi:2-polyprenyl-6-methoxyphenol hydroxylase-like FAD-dependent oxidoreductase